MPTRVYTNVHQAAKKIMTSKKEMIMKLGEVLTCLKTETDPNLDEIINKLEAISNQLENGKKNILL
jgi:hypothetical protein